MDRCLQASHQTSWLQGGNGPSFPKSLSHDSISPALSHSKHLQSKSFPSHCSIADIERRKEEHKKLYSRYKVEKDIRSVQRDSVRDADVEQDVLSSIEPAFFQLRDSGDCEDFVAQKLPESLDLDFIIAEKNRLKKQLAIVSRKATDLMTRHQAAYFSELQRVISLQRTVNDCLNTCAKARSCLSSSRNSLTLRSLKIVSSAKRRENLVDFLTVLADQRQPRAEQDGEAAVKSDEQDKQDGDGEEESDAGNSGRVSQARASPITEAASSSSVKRPTSLSSPAKGASNVLLTSARESQ